MPTQDPDFTITIDIYETAFADGMAEMHTAVTIDPPLPEPDPAGVLAPVALVHILKRHIAAAFDEFNGVTRRIMEEQN